MRPVRGSRIGDRFRGGVLPLTVLALSALVLLPTAATASPAGASTPTWSSQGLPWSTPGPLEASLNDVWCASKTKCIGVGGAQSGALVSTLAKGNWIDAVIAPPAGSTSATLSSLTCLSITVCTAVGSVVSGGTTLPLVAALSKGKWTMEALTAPSSASTATLSGVACPTTSSCVAVGAAGENGLIETLSSGTWTPVIIGPPAGDDINSLSSVSCSTTTHCMAVGTSEYEGAKGPLSAGFVASLSRSMWTGLQLDPSGGTNGGSSLNALICTSASSCVAVGSSEGDALVERWTHGTWTPTTGIDPTSYGADLNSISCSSATKCVALGSYGYLETEGVLEGAFTETLAHGAWKPAEPSGLPNGALGLFCQSAAACVAVQGSAIATLKAGSWSTISLPGPPDASLTSVSCQSASACTAVGTYLDAGGSEHLLVEALAGGSWAPVSVALNVPYLATPVVSCVDTTCVIVSGNVAASSSGGPWTVTTLPDAGSITPNVDSISCTAATACVAVGNPGGEGSVLLVETLTSMGWTAAELPNPPTSSGGNLAGVSCQSSTSCVAVGSADAPGLEALVESLSGTTWTASVLSPPSGFNYANLNGVTCSASTSCVAVGSYFPSFGGYGDALVETLATGSWSPTTGFADGDFSGLSSIGCITMTSSSCVALGSIFTTSPPGQLAVALSGGSWTQTSVSLPSGSDTAFLTGASCLTSCTGAGSDQQSWSVLPGYQATYPMVATFG